MYAVCCSVMQCDALCCSVLQCGAVCCSVLQGVAVWVAYTYMSRVRYTHESCQEFIWVIFHTHEYVSTHTHTILCISELLSVLQCVLQCVAVRVAVCCSYSVLANYLVSGFRTGLHTRAWVVSDLYMSHVTYSYESYVTHTNAPVQTRTKHSVVEV